MAQTEPADRSDWMLAFLVLFSMQKWLPVPIKLPGFFSSRKESRNPPRK